MFFKEQKRNSNVLCKKYVAAAIAPSRAANKSGSSTRGQHSSPDELYEAWPECPYEL